MSILRKISCTPRRSSRQASMKTIHAPVILLAFMGCSDSRPEAREQAETAAVRPPAVAVVPDPLPPVSSNPVHWSPALIPKALEDAGLEMVGVPSPIDAPFLSAPGARMTFVGPGGGRGELRAFIYGDAGAVARDLAGIDTVRVAARGTRLEWGMPARLITDNNLIAILLTNDSRIREIVERTLRQID